MINFNRMPTIYWDNKTKISYLQRLIILYSIMYYELNESCVTDSYYDSVSKQLLSLQNEDIKSTKESQYYYLFYDFDGFTGFDIYSRLNKSDKEYLRSIAMVVLNQWKRERNAKCDKAKRANK